MIGFSCGQETSMDESVLTNPSFPEPDSSSGHCTFRLRVTSNNVCQVKIHLYFLIGFLNFEATPLFNLTVSFEYHRRDN